ncbi:DUF6435 family protein [Cognaticolwellia beringensis]|uniref:Lacal_2735 family protein n=1 Tax=Cognaticolwellia beringensis TaxID=1967665 RepID=A0A222G696_9GAMM|nr:DUF6435 family protein [Cognaticolwellia beringensis]ASP47331.1 hypothetical protein B5D82_05865 [Cognaticolwellia beringensis]
MFSLFIKHETKKLNKRYEEKLAKAICAQKHGDISAFSMFAEEALIIRQKIQALEKPTKA